MSYFKLLTSFTPDYCPSKVHKWRSTRSGLQVVLIEQERPIVEGYFAVATEIEDDSGCPHTLEHLIFMGSKKYPFKGLLDTLGNRAFSNTNAWTATDSTVYTLSTAGWEGFRLLLPVYLDHLINPTLTDSACYTEVYHVDGEGNEKGVVFSEMQGVENEAETIATFRSKKIMYPEKSGYSSETGGLMGALRVLTADRIREFYHGLYRPDNLCLIIVGTVDKDELLETVGTFDETLPVLPQMANKRPFVDSPSTPRLPKTVIDTVEFPDKDESSGHILLSFLGPPNLDFLTNTALHCLLMYLTDSDVSLLRRKIVEIENPLSTELEVYTDDFIETGLNVWLHNVPTEQLEAVETKVFEILREHVEKSEFDLQQMHDVIERERLQYVLQAERYSSTLANLAIEDFLYGKLNGESFTQAKHLSEYVTVLQYGVHEWECLIEKWLLNNPHVAVLARPSAALAKQLRKGANLRLKHRREELGEKGLERLARQLQLAQEENEKKIPDNLLSTFPAPDPAKVNFISSVTAKAGLALNGSEPKSEVQDILDKDSAQELPLYVHFEHVKSNFVSISLLLSSAVIPQDLLPYLFILLGNFYSTPIVLDDGTTLDYEQVVKELKKDTIANNYYIGFDGEFEEMISFELQVVPDNYGKAVEWFRRLIWNSKFDPQRLQIVIEKALMGLSESKRSGSYMVSSATKRLLLTNRSARRSLDELEMESLLLKLSKDVKVDPKPLIANLELLRSILFTPENFRVIISADIKQLAKPASSWNGFLAGALSSPTTKSLVSVSRSYINNNEEGARLGGKVYLLPVPSTESSYATLLTNGPTDFKHPHIPALAVAATYLEAVEGPFWRGIRGNGLAYGASVIRFIEGGNTGFRIYRAADAPIAIQKAKEIVESYASGAADFEPLLIDSAISIIVSAIAEADNNYYAAASRKFLQEVMKGLGENANQTFLASVRTVTANDMRHALKEFLLPIFNVEKGHVFIACNPVKIAGMKEVFEKEGYEVIVDPFDALKQSIGAVAIDGAELDGDEEWASDSNEDSDYDDVEEDDEDSESEEMEE
ncbi:Metalloenzyme, LuxS/M16 peptidase-like protein [Lipomyces kononenkoae]|uniref:Metalloenzyme, LuxS/M16 peptidase-like protein n=1 Tax=Lipomyces kononenkoae TaxID=34357 RepID=A0ACC3T0W9_LIPKO